MKNLLAVILIIGAIAVLPTDAVYAQAGTDNGGNLGLGIMLGEPTGASVKVWNGERTAFDIGAAWSLAGRGQALHMHSDFLFHSWFEDTENLAFYFGIGGRVIFDRNANAGVRLPIGLNYVFEDIPFDLFIEAAPILDVTPDPEFAGNGAVGIRYYF